MLSHHTKLDSYKSSRQSIKVVGVKKWWPGP